MTIRRNDGERLQKVLARAGFGSRRACEELIAEKRVTVNGQVAVLGRRVDPERDQIEVDGIPTSVRHGLVYYLLNKPRGAVTTTSDPHHRLTVVDLVPLEPRVFSVGRLDADSEGLLILTNDGDLAFRLTHPSFGVEKEYVVEVEGGPSPSALRSLREGIDLDDGRTAPADVVSIAPRALRLVIHEGRNRQVRRMCAAVGHPVTRLVRVRIGPIADRRLKPGQWRPLTVAEVRSLERSVARAQSSTVPGQSTTRSDGGQTGARLGTAGELAGYRRRDADRTRTTPNPGPGELGTAEPGVGEPGVERQGPD